MADIVTVNPDTELSHCCRWICTSITLIASHKTYVVLHALSYKFAAPDVASPCLGYTYYSTNQLSLCSLRAIVCL